MQTIARGSGLFKKQRGPLCYSGIFRGAGLAIVTERRNLTDSVKVIDTEGGLGALAAVLAETTELAVDTESNSFYNYREKVCLLQVSTPDADYIVDTIAVPDLSPLEAIFADTEKQKVFHAAENDILLLKKHHAFRIRNVFDTLLAAQILGYREVGLASLVGKLFSVRLDKGEQRSDWSRRPLSEEQIAYAVRDTRYLIRLRDHLKGELHGVNRIAAAEEEFTRLAAKEPIERLPDPLAYLRLKGARALSPEKRGVLQALFEWREKTAQETDRPPFRVISNEALMELASLASTTWDNLGRIRGVTPRLIARFGDEILTAIRLGLEEGEKRPPKPDRKRRAREIWTDEMEARFQRLREWRNRRAQEMNVEPFIVASSRILETLAREAPDSLEGIAGVPEIGSWRVRDYGEEILTALRNGQRSG